MWDEEEELEVVPTSGASKNPAMCYPSSGWNHQNARPSFILCAVNSPSFGSLLVNDNWGGGVEGMRPTTTNEGTFLYISPVQTLYGNLWKTTKNVLSLFWPTERCVTDAL